jgi:hypothetical protein
MFCPASPITVTVTLLKWCNSAKPVPTLGASKASHRGKNLGFICLGEPSVWGGNVSSDRDRRPSSSAGANRLCEHLSLSLNCCKLQLLLTSRQDAHAKVLKWPEDLTPRRAKWTENLTPRRQDAKIGRRYEPLCRPIAFDSVPRPTESLPKNGTCPILTLCSSVGLLRKCNESAEVNIFLLPLRLGVLA